MPATMSKEMIDLIIRLRRRVHAEFKTTLKLANPALLEELIALHARSRDPETREMIRTVLELAGGDWLNRLSRSTPGRYYRGQKIAGSDGVGAGDNPGDGSKTRRNDPESG